MGDAKATFSLALITGASSGIGEELARLLAKQKINLILVGRNQEKLESLTKELQDQVEVSIVRADLTHKDERKEVIDKIRTLVPDLVINDAGISWFGKALASPLEKQMEILEVNGAALLEITLETARIWKTRGSKGVIMNISSAAGFFVIPNFSVYSASKAFVTHVSEALDLEWEPDGIRVLAACPGFVNTPLASKASSGKTDGRDMKMVMDVTFVAKEIWQQILQTKPVKIIDWRFRLIYYASRLIPSFIQRKLSKSMMKLRPKKG